MLVGKSGEAKGRRVRNEISPDDATSPTLTLLALATGVREPDSESRIRAGYGKPVRPV